MGTNGTIISQLTPVSFNAVIWLFNLLCTEYEKLLKIYKKIGFENY
jgi:hypothetical protein